jgi:hypothetical protein
MLVLQFENSGDREIEAPPAVEYTLAKNSYSGEPVLVLADFVVGTVRC